MLTPYPHLLPPNATGFERALSGPTGRITAIPSPIDTLWRWEACPEAFLPWLAWALSVDLWDETWPVERKRGMIRESFDLHRKKGTLYCIGRYLDYADAKLIRAVTPPAKAFHGSAMTVARRNEWLARFPQIRIYPYRSKGTAQRHTFHGGAVARTFHGSGSSNGESRLFLRQSTSWERYGRRAFLWDKGPHHKATGLETPLRWIETTDVTREGVATTFEQVFIPGTGKKALFWNHDVTGNRNGKDGRRFWVRSDAGNRVVTVSVERGYILSEPEQARRASVPPSLTPIQAFPERIGEPGQAIRGIHIFRGSRQGTVDPVTNTLRRNKGFHRGFHLASTSGERIYDRLHLHDPERLPVGGHPRSFFNNMRFGIKPFNAELAVEVTGHRSRHEMVHGRFHRGFFSKPKTKPLEKALEAINRAKSARDRILVNPRVYRIPTTADGVRTSDGYRTGTYLNLGA